MLEPGEPLLERGVTLLETSLEPCCWNPVAGTSGWNICLGTNAGVDFVFLFALFLALLTVPGCDVGSLAGFFAGTGLQPCWNLCEDNFWTCFSFVAGKKDDDPLLNFVVAFGKVPARLPARLVTV